MLLIQNATVVNEGKISTTDVLIENERILKIAPSIDGASCERVIDATGKWLIPGMIDDQVHFREPGLTHKATIASESKAALAGGITSFLEMPNTTPQTTDQEQYNWKLDKAQETSYANYGFMFGGTNTNLEEVKNIDIQKVPGLKLFLGSSTGNMLVDDPEVLKEIFSSTPLPISVHCEDEQTIRDNTKQYVEKYGDEIPIELHPIIRSEQACYLSSSKAVALAKETGARLHVFHLSTAKELELFEANIPLKEKKITAEVCIHHLWFSDKDYQEKGTHIKWNPAVKTENDRKALIAALKEGKIDIIATDHAPHTLEEKNNPYTKAPSGGPLVQHALCALVDLHRKENVPLETIVEKACHNPATLFSIKDRGFIREGYYADLVLIDPDTSWTVAKDNILYQCGWSPFEGHTFSSKISHTILNGTVVYENDKLYLDKRFSKALTFER